MAGSLITSKTLRVFEVDWLDEEMRQSRISSWGAVLHVVAYGSAPAGVCPGRDKAAFAVQHNPSTIKNERPFFFLRSLQDDR
jgi:hypothetical protein